MRLSIAGHQAWLQVNASSAEFKGDRQSMRLAVRCELDEADYPKGIAVSDAEFAAIKINPADFHGEWTYTISPSRSDRAVVPDSSLAIA
jgi:hypothetical protein